jgi:hypothetical protein
MRRYRQHPERFVRDHADDAGLRQSLAEGTRAAITAAIVRIRGEEAAALDQLRAMLRR